MGLLGIRWPGAAAFDQAIGRAAAQTPPTAELDDEDTQPLNDGRAYGIATATRITPEPG